MLSQRVLGRNFNGIPNTASSNGEVGVKSKRTRAIGPLSSAEWVEGANEDGVGVACPDATINRRIRFARTN